MEADRVEESYHHATTGSTRSTRKKRSGKDDFANAIARIAVAQVCEGAGFQSFQQWALDTLSDVAVRYILEIGKTAIVYTNLAGRTECNVYDLIQGLDDLGSVLGFADASDVNQCLGESGTVREIAHYVSDAEEIPFAYLIPEFPAFMEQKPNTSLVRSGETVPYEHIPAWLPVFPDPKTYSRSHLQNQREPEMSVDKIEQVQDKKKMEHSILSLRQRITSNGFETPLAVDPGNVAKDKTAADCNPFLVPPLQLEEKEISSIVHPILLSDEALIQNRTALENHVPMLKTFAPATEAVKSGLYDSREDKKSILLDNRPPVRLKFGMVKKFVGTAQSIQSKGFEKATSWFGDNNDRDEKEKEGGADSEGIYGEP